MIQLDSVPPGTSLGRYRVGTEIGRGGMGVVYEASDAAGGPALAIKVILPHLLALPQMRERFLREARLGLAIVDDNVVRTLDLGEAKVGDRTLHYLVMERVHGRTLRRLLEDLGTVPEGLLREIARQASAGLSALHAAGVVHRDLKPENLLLADDRRLRIMDLGVAKVSGTDALLTHEGQFIGSLRYAAPEQIEGRDVGPASDLYSLGIVLYELATGRPPFEGQEPLALVRAHLEATPVSAAAGEAGVSEFLAEVIATLLRKKPDERLGSARELSRVLVEAEGGPWWEARRRSAAARPRTLPKVAPTHPLIGRGAEREMLLEAWRAVRDGEGRVVLLVGEPGIGKSRLVEELLRSVADEQAHVLPTGFAPAGEPEGLREALVGATRPTDLPGEVGSRLGLAGPLAAAFASFLRREAPPPGVQALSPQAGEALMVRYVQRLAEEAPVVWVVEDLHFAPAGSLATTLAMARAVAGRRILMVLTSRPGLDAAYLSEVERLPHATRLDLARLAAPDVEALVAATVGETALGGLVTRAIAPRADGIPFFVVEMLKELERRGHLRRSGDGLHAGAPLEGLDVPRAVRDLVRARLAALSAEERATLDAAAVEGFEFEPDLVARVRGVPRIHVLELLGRLERRDGMIRSGPRLARFDHHLLQEVVYDDLAQALRAEAHGRLADALETAPGVSGPAEARLARVVAHRLRGPEPERALPLLRDAASHLERTFRLEAAADLVRRALDLPTFGPGPERVDALIRLGRLSTTLGRPKLARKALDEAVSLADRLGLRFLRLDAWLALTNHMLAVGSFAEALSSADTVVQLADASGEGRSRADAHGHRGQALWCLGRHREARACHEEALRLAREAGSRRLESHALANLSVVLHEMGFVEEAEARCRDALRIMREDGDRRNEAAITCNHGNVLQDLGRKAEALACYESSVSMSREIVDPAGEAIAWVNLGEVRLRLGDLQGGREAILRCERMSRDMGLRRVEGFGLHGLALAASWSGDAAGARAYAEQALALRREIQNRGGIVDTLLLLGALDAEAGHAGPARERLEEAARLADEIGDPSAGALARLRLGLLPGADGAAARAFYLAQEARLRHDARLEGRWLLWRQSRDPADLTAARALLDWQCAHAPPECKASMLENVPHHRELANG